MIISKASINQYKWSYKILLKLHKYLEANPEIRFCQALNNLGINETDHHGAIKDNFNDRDDQVFKRLKQ